MLVDTVFLVERKLELHLCHPEGAFAATDTCMI
jgi:hypothetical protein